MTGNMPKRAMLRADNSTMPGEKSHELMRERHAGGRSMHCAADETHTVDCVLNSLCMVLNS